MIKFRISNRDALVVGLEETLQHLEKANARLSDLINATTPTDRVGRSIRCIDQAVGTGLQALSCGIRARRSAAEILVQIRRNIRSGIDVLRTLSLFRTPFDDGLAEVSGLLQKVAGNGGLR